MRRLAVIVALALSLAAPARADTIKIGRLSQQLTPSQAAVSASIDRSHLRPGRASQPRPAQAHEQTAARASALAPPPLPVLAASSPLYHNPHPFGPASLWYAQASGTPCIYLPDSSPLCFTLATTASAASAPGSNPITIATSVARRLILAAGRIDASPARAGLTGAASWFWLDPPPRPRQLSVSLAGETVTVSAEPAVLWRFGDGAMLEGGAGIPYRAGPAPPDAVTHVYETRCLPGDQGHDPYVLAACGQGGYRVEALVEWRIAYAAAGPVAGRGTLPERTTETAASYPVTEVRAFLASGGGGA